MDRVPPVNPAFTEMFSPSILTVSGGGSEIYSCRQQNSWALTFDDGPSPHTRTLLVELKRRNIKATFFVKGQQVLKHPDILQQIHAEGHEIGIHTWSHPSLYSLTNAQIITEAMYTHQIIQDLIGVSSRYFRAPFGSTDSRINGLLTQMGFSVIRWNRDTRDFTGPVVSQYVNSWLSEAGLIGTISLQHDLLPDTAVQAPGAMDLILKSRYQLKTVSQCVGIGAYGPLRFKSKDDKSPIVNPPVTAVKPTTLNPQVTGINPPTNTKDKGTSSTTINAVVSSAAPSANTPTVINSVEVTQTGTSVDATSTVTPVLVKPSASATPTNSSGNKSPTSTIVLLLTLAVML
ncbi:hypothetical protein BC833DRAFT_597605 [Globomyces pollinis-pini]|nr:hypothetical protein BC833DRAFT_597605 [Globomyces pollinis-pini]